MGRGVFTWAVEHCYLTENPFAKIKKKREGEKTRTIIPAEDRTRIFNYFKENNPAMCIIMQMVFTSLIRPIDITRIQLEDFVNHCIHLPGTNIIAPADLMGYRNHPVYGRKCYCSCNLRSFFIRVHTPIHGRQWSYSAIYNEQHACNRGILWVIIPTERREEYMRALEIASVENDITKLCEFIATLLK